jgi:hypothetical protein
MATDSVGTSPMAVVRSPRNAGEAFR